MSSTRPFFAFGFSGSDIFWCLKAGRAGRGSGDADALTFSGVGGGAAAVHLRKRKGYSEGRVERGPLTRSLSQSERGEASGYY